MFIQQQQSGSNRNLEYERFRGGIIQSVYFYRFDPRFYACVEISKQVKCVI
jgi:hypothetical protein